MFTIQVVREYTKFYTVFYRLIYTTEIEKYNFSFNEVGNLENEYA